MIEENQKYYIIIQHKILKLEDQLRSDKIHNEKEKSDLKKMALTFKQEKKEMTKLKVFII